MVQTTATTRRAGPDVIKGAVEGDRPDEPQSFNASALDENGLPREMVPICEDVIGTNVDSRGREAGTADAAVYPTETGTTNVGRGLSPAVTVALKGRPTTITASSP